VFQSFLHLRGYCKEIVNTEAKAWIKEGVRADGGLENPTRRLTVDAALKETYYDGPQVWRASYYSQSSSISCSITDSFDPEFYCATLIGCQPQNAVVVQREVNIIVGPVGRDHGVGCRFECLYEGRALKVSGNLHVICTCSAPE
jgi:hypothetical protein